MTERVLGFQISEKNGIVDWKEVGKSHFQFGFVKATEGNSVFDTTFDANWLGLRNAGMLRGAVHVFDPLIEPQKQAEYFLNYVADVMHASDLPPVLMVDVNQKELFQAYYKLPMAQRLNRIHTWLEIVEKVVGKTPLLLTNRNTWQYTLGNNKSFGDYPLWIEETNAGAPHVFCDDWQGSSWKFWQYSQNGMVDGICMVHMSLFNGTMADLHTFANFEVVRPLLEEMTNAQFSNALFATADDLRISSLNFLDTCDCRYLIQSYAFRNRLYNGLAVAEMNLSMEEENTFRNQLVQVLSNSPFYLENMTNQEMINAVYGAAMILNVNGWALLEKAGLTELVNAPDEHYIGLKIEELPLSAEEREHLMDMVGVKTEEQLLQGIITPTYHELITNQDVLNCIYHSAILLNVQGWELLKKAELTTLAFNRIKVYDGVKIGDIESLNDNEKTIIQDEIDKLIPFGDVEPYPGLLNQDLVNIFYKAAIELDVSGWILLKKAKMERIVAKDLRFEPYCGPVLEKIESLTNAEIQVIDKAKRSCF